MPPLRDTAAGIPSGPPRLILLGASNLTRGLSTIIDISRQQFQAPLDIHAALGRGRSFGIASSLLGRGLAGIADSPLWPALNRLTDTRPTYAIITDVGNDVMYGVEPVKIIGWVGDAIERIRRFDCQTRFTMTQLPLARIERIRPAEFHVARRILFPRHTMTYNETMRHVSEVAGAIERLAGEQDIPLVQQRIDWYGLDPIHVRHRDMQRAWRMILEPWWGARRTPDTVDRSVAASHRERLAQWWALAGARPQTYTLFGRRKQRAQPTVRLRDGTTISLY